MEDESFIWITSNTWSAWTPGSIKNLAVDKICDVGLRRGSNSSKPRTDSRYNGSIKFKHVNSLRESNSSWRRYICGESCDSNGECPRLYIDAINKPNENWSDWGEQVYVDWISGAVKSKSGWAILGNLGVNELQGTAACKSKNKFKDENLK